MKKNKIFAILLFIFLVIIIITIYSLIANNKNNIDEKNTIQKAEMIDIYTIEDEEKTNIEIKESDEKMERKIVITINNKEYTALLDENETAWQFEKMLPMDIKMNELNGNEKYCYLDTTFIINSYSPKHIEKGDIMLYGNNCLVIFYKSFDTSYTYTKIGHIDNLDDLENGNLEVKFEQK